MKTVLSSCVACLSAIAFASSAQPVNPSPPPAPAAAADELYIEPIDYTQDVEGVPVDIKTGSYLSLKTSNNALLLRARVSADLNDLQQKIGSIVDTIPLPRDNCRSKSANNPVVTVWGKELQATGDTATLVLHGHVDDWDCRDNPIPNSKVEWQVKDVGFGIKTKVPVIVTWPGDPIKNKLGSQPFDVSVPVRLIRVDATTVRLDILPANVHLGGQYVGITNGILNIAGINISDKATELMRKAVDPDKLKVGVPADYLKLNPSIETVSFSSEGGILHANLVLSAQVSGAVLNQMLQPIVGSLKPKA